MGSYFVKVLIQIVKWIIKQLIVIAMFVPVENPNHIIHDKPLMEEYDFIVGENYPYAGGKLVKIHER